MDKTTVIARKKARRLALQALYQWMMAASDLADIEAQFHVNNDMSKVDTQYFSVLLRNIPLKVAELDESIEPFLDRKLTDLNPVELTILRMGAYELKERLDIPYKVAINEAVKLAQEYGAEDGHKYVNGVLDKLARQIRTVEIDQKL